MTDVKGNGSGIVKVDMLTLDEKLDILVEAVAQLSDSLAEIRTQQEEIVEKLVNLSLGGVDYDIDFEES